MCGLTLFGAVSSTTIPGVASGLAVTMWPVGLSTATLLYTAHIGAGVEDHLSANSVMTTSAPELSKEVI